MGLPREATDLCEREINLILFKYSHFFSEIWMGTTYEILTQLL